MQEIKVNKDVEKINSLINILDLVKDLGIDIEKRGKNYFALCPFHEEKTPSFSISPDKNIAICMGCHKGGAPFNFYKEVKKLTFQQALLELSQKLGIEVSFKSSINQKYKRHYELMKSSYELYKYVLFNTNYGKPFLDYLQKERNLSLETINKFNIGCIFDSKTFLSKTLLDNGYEKDLLLNTKMSKLGYNNELLDTFTNRLMFPIFDSFKNCIAFSGRLITKDDNNPKYFNSPESVIFKKANTIYNLENALVDNKEKEVILVEGFFDVIALDNIGMYNLIATMGTAFSNEHIKILEKKINTLTLLFDGDNAGQAATFKAIEKLKFSKLNVNICLLKEGLDPDEFIKKYGKEEFLKVLNNKKDMYTFLYEEYEKRYNLENNNQLYEFIKLIEKDFANSNLVIKNKYKTLIKEKYGYELNYQNNYNNINNFNNNQDYIYDDYVYEIDEKDFKDVIVSNEPIYYQEENNYNQNNYYDYEELPDTNLIQEDNKYNHDNIKKDINTNVKVSENGLINGKLLNSKKYDNALETILIYLIYKNEFNKEEEKDILNLETIKFIKLNKEYINLLNNIKYYISYKEKFILKNYKTDLELEENNEILNTLNNIINKFKSINIIPSKKDFQQAILNSINCLKQYEKLVEKIIPTTILSDENRLNRYLKKLTDIDREKNEKR